MTKVSTLSDVRIHAIYVSPGHNFVGHHGKPPGEHPVEAVPEVECVEGKGLRGDRFFGHGENYKGQITFIAREDIEEVAKALGREPPDPASFRRNVVTGGVNLHDWIGRRFRIQGILFEGVEHCRPCYWMDRAVGPGAEKAMDGRGGLRARILSSGILRINEGEGA